MNTKKKAMISQPMAGKTNGEVVEVRGEAVAVLEGLGYEVVNTLFTDGDMEGRGDMKVPPYIPVYCLAMSLMGMGRCDAVYFCEGWEDARGCRIEHGAAVACGLQVMYD